MKLVLSSGDVFVLRFDSGEEIISWLIRFTQENKITAAAISGIGSSKEAELGYYDIAAKEYRKKIYSRELEVVGLSGNISVLNNEPVIHLHGVLSNENYDTVGGHIHRLVVSATIEITIMVLRGEIHRKPDSETGLNLLD
ncbi:MAG: DNA-binding protein [Patescibacteria group bacterium]|nr:DNA-binding protein [Patescibacteria group bacterium]MDE2144657.1 DNA-binding protein [Patescibacteria group bacterium]